MQVLDDFSALDHKLDASSGESRTILSQMQVNQLLTLPLWANITSSGDSLRFCRSIDRRSGGRVQVASYDVEQLNE